MSDGTPWRPLVHVEDIAQAFAEVLVAPREIVHNEAFNIGAAGENHQVRDLATIVQKTVPGCRVEYAEGAGPDLRSYRVDFSKFARAVPTFVTRWNATRGAQQLYETILRFGLTEIEFQDRKYRRLGQLQYLLSTGQLDESLRWRQVAA